jgi:hypothetical protein
MILTDTKGAYVQGTLADRPHTCMHECIRTYMVKRTQVRLDTFATGHKHKKNMRLYTVRS